MSTVGRWTGHEARALRLALRLSVRAFAGQLGLAVRTISKWERGGRSTTPWPDSQAILDTTLAQAPDDVKARFAQLVDGAAPEVAAGQPASLYIGDSHTGSRRSHAPDLESWADDLDRVVVYLSRQDFGLADRLLSRWLNAVETDHLTDRAAYLRARSLTLFGDMQRDQGVLLGPLSATKAYQQAFTGYRQLHIDRRMAQIQLNLTVVTEMAGQLETAAAGYGELANDERLNGLDQARARLWVGTALSKRQQHEPAITASLDAIQRFEQLDAPEEWSAAHQKLALAYLNGRRPAEVSAVH
jgi:transcriptional regulator with XRE-family HTH domain